MNSTTVVAIVDPYSSGSQLARELKSRGFPCLMVQSEEVIPAMYRSSLHVEDFDAVIQHRSFEETSARLRALRVGCVISGCEMGVELADFLSQQLGLVSNGTRLSSERRNKFLMLNLLREHQLRVPRQFTSRRLDEVTNWVSLHGHWPVVLKPLCSSGSDGVRLCHHDVDVRDAFDQIMNGTNAFGATNDAVLVQEFLNGTEYAVDTVSYAGHHKVAAFWKYGKHKNEGSGFGTETLELLPYDPRLNDRLVPYVDKVLDALEIKYGPAHCELMWVDNEPVIVEIGARLNGGNNPSLSKQCNGESQIDLTIDAYLDPEQFLADLDTPYLLPKSAMRVFLTPRQKGRFRAISGIERIEQLTSFHEIKVSAKPGRPLSRIAGWVVLVHEDRGMIHNDLQEIRRLEMNGLYKIEPETDA